LIFNKNSVFTSVALTLIVFLIACKSNEKNATLTISAASNLQFVMPELIESFSNKTGLKCELVTSSSGKLTAQIKEGAPYDIFLSADNKYPEFLHQNGLTENVPKTYAYGKLVFLSDRHQSNLSINLLTDENIKHIAVANPKTAPYGRATIEVLNYYDLYDKIKHKLVYGESIAQVNQFVTSKAAEVGFTALSVVQSFPTKGNWVILDTLSYTPIKQDIVCLKQAPKKMKASKEFYKFMISKEAKMILKNYGYIVDE